VSVTTTNDCEAGRRQVAGPHDLTVVNAQLVVVMMNAVLPVCLTETFV